MSRFLFVALTLLLLSVPSQTMAGPPTRAWMSRLGGLPIQDGGRVMPLDTYARNLAVELTGRTSFPASTGPEGFAGKHHMELLCDLLFNNHAQGLLMTGRGSCLFKQHQMFS